MVSPSPKKPYDPRALVKNPEIKEAMRAIARDYKDLKAAVSFAEIKGCAAILGAQIEHLMDQPEFIPAGVADGAVSGERCYFAASEIPEVDRFLNERPFDSPGESSGLFFFYTDTGKFSPLYGPPVMDPYNVQILWLHGYFVHALEKRYATEAPTVNHVRQTGVCIQMLAGNKMSGQRGKELESVLLLDPCGCAGSSSMKSYALAYYRDEGEARRAAEFLAAELSIRFVVARRIYSLCTH